MRTSECTFCVSYYYDYPGEYYIFCHARRSDYFETVGAFKTQAAAEAVLRDMEKNGGMISDYRRIYGG